MKQLVAAALVALTLGGCAQMQSAGTAISVVTKTYDNPVTERELYQIEASLRIAAEALLTYRRACIAGTVDLRCRENIEAIQPYTRQVHPLLVQLRDFVRRDDRVNAISVYRRLSDLYTTITNEAARRGVSIGS